MLLTKSAAPPQRIGYARVSTDEQDVAHQVAALKAKLADLENGAGRGAIEEAPPAQAGAGKVGGAVVAPTEITVP